MEEADKAGTKPVNIRSSSSDQHDKRGSSSDNLSLLSALLLDSGKRTSEVGASSSFEGAEANNDSTLLGNGGEKSDLDEPDIKDEPGCKSEEYVGVKQEPEEKGSFASEASDYCAKKEETQEYIVVREEHLRKVKRTRNNRDKTLFALYPALKDHVSVSSDGEIKCGICNLTYGRQNKLKHHILKKHLGAIFCKTCYEVFETQDVRKLHVLSEHAHKCMQCDRTFSDKTGLTCHIAAAHDSATFVCTICDKSFGALHLLKKHEKRIHIRSEPFLCPQCSKSFPNKHYLNQHIDRKHNTPKVVCGMCGKIVSSVLALRLHEKNLHSDNPTLYECKVCKKVYRALNSRIRCEDKHAGNARYKCNLCDKAYYVKSSLDIHTRIHTGEKPYECWLCNRRFYTHQILLKHALSHGLTPDTFKAEFKKRNAKTTT